MSDATIYCDRLRWGSCVGLVRQLRALGVRRPVVVHVLDPIPVSWRGLVLRTFMRLFGYDPQEAEFFAGHLRVPEGPLAQRAAFDFAMPAALAESVRMVASSPLLDEINRQWGRETIRLHLCKSLARSSGETASIYGYALRVQCARALSSDPPQDTVLLIEQPVVFAASCLGRMAPELRIVCYGATAALVTSKLHLFRQGVRASLRRLRGLWCRTFRAEQLSALRRLASARPNLLLLQEDDIGLDRSHRGQPHWLRPEDPPTAYETFILSSVPSARVRHDQAALDDANIRVLSDDDVLALSSAAAAEPIARTLRRSARACFLAGWRSRSAPETHGLAMLARLLLTASELAGVCRQLRIRAFMTSENHLLAGDAMPLIGDALDVHTLSYQYSNLATLSPLMLTTADVMLTFAPAYHAHWVHETIGPKAFVDVGYLFDSSFALVRPRARAAKDRLRAAGATFVITYFDENVIRSKYALTDADDHCKELRVLFNLVLADPSVGLVTKVQFQRNSPSRFPELGPLVAAAAATGRYLELVHGVHRNNVLPAEAALAADMAIGHAIGGTAPMEAALAGVRTILLNPYGMRDANHAVYERADILIATLEEAVEAMAAFRSGRRAGLGDWTPVIDHFDAYRDGRAGARIRAALDYLMADVGSKREPADLADGVRCAVEQQSGARRART